MDYVEYIQKYVKTKKAQEECLRFGRGSNGDLKRKVVTKLLLQIIEKFEQARNQKK